MNPIEKEYENYLKNIREIFKEKNIKKAEENCEDITKMVKTRDKLYDELKNILYNSIYILIEENKMYLDDWTVRENSIYYHKTSKIVSLEKFIQNKSQRNQIIENIKEERDKKYIEKIIERIIQNKQKISKIKDKNYYIIKSQETKNISPNQDIYISDTI